MIMIFPAVDPAALHTVDALLLAHGVLVAPVLEPLLRETSWSVIRNGYLI